MLQMKIFGNFCIKFVLGFAVLAFALPQAAAEKPKKVKTMTAPTKTESSAPVASQAGLPLFYRALAPFSKNAHAQLQFPEMPAKYTFAAKTNVIPLLITEVAHAEPSYPIVFMSSGDKEALALVALVGLNGENRYVSKDGQWVPGVYVPAWVRRYPFFAVRVEDKAEPMLAIDPTYEFLNAQGGQPFFDKEGNATERLTKVLEFNVAYQKDAQRTQMAIDALKQSGVLEEGTLQRRAAKEGETKNFTGFWVVNEKKLMALSDDQIIQLHRSGGLGLAYAQMLSMRNIKHLID